MSGQIYSTSRDPRQFAPATLRLLAVDESSYSRGVIMEVLRGVGLQNDNIQFVTPKELRQNNGVAIMPDVIMIVHASDEIADFDFVRELRRMDNQEFAECPVLFLSAIATQNNIVEARDCGCDEFLTRPVSPQALKMKLRKVIEAPQPFINSPNYVGPCRRRKAKPDYTGPYRRLNDFQKDESREIKDPTGVNELAEAVTELRSACGELSSERLGLVARVREVAARTMQLAKETDDSALYKTSLALKYYLDGVGSSHHIEPHVLETGINALTQLSVLPGSYDNARNSVANLLTFAVRKKLAFYQKRRQMGDAESDEIFQQINDQVTEELEFEITDDPPKKSSSSHA